MKQKKPKNMEWLRVILESLLVERKLTKKEYYRLTENLYVSNNAAASADIPPISKDEIAYRHKEHWISEERGTGNDSCKNN